MMQKEAEDNLNILGSLLIGVSCISYINKATGSLVNETHAAPWTVAISENRKSNGMIWHLAVCRS